MPRKLILDGNTVYELDEECMLRQKTVGYTEETLATRMNKEDEEKAHMRQQKGRRNDTYNV